MPALKRSGERGAALILEIIIYLVIVALIAVAVTSGVRAVRDLVFTSHAKGDIKTVQTWVEGKYSQDNVYPTFPGNGDVTDPAVVLTTANGVTNQAWLFSKNGADSGYCIRVGSMSISEPNKRWFYLSSANPSRIMQTGTATSNGAAADGTRPPSGIAGLNCP